MPVVNQEIIEKEVYVKNCGVPMNRHWKTIKDREFKIGFPVGYNPITLPNYDAPNCRTLKSEDVVRFREVFWRNVGIPKIDKRKKRYLLIDRGNQPNFYNKIKRTSAGTRRYIKEIKKVHEELSAEYPFELHYLEHMELAEQAHLFYSADVIVLQHGAAMFNTIFCRPDTLIIELTRDFWRYYGKWSLMCGVRRIVLPEPFNKKPNTDAIIKTIKGEKEQPLDVIDI